MRRRGGVAATQRQHNATQRQHCNLEEIRDSAEDQSDLVPECQGVRPEGAEINIQLAEEPVSGGDAIPT